MSVYSECLGELARGRDELWTMPACPPTRRSWFDKERADRGRRFFLDNMLQCTVCMMESLICGFSIPNFSRPLTLTNQSSRPEDAARRYLTTFRHLLLWHCYDILDADSPGHQSVLHVNKAHERSKRLVNAGGARYFTQYDMSLVMCGFIGLIVMYPRENGILCSDAELNDFIHLWRVIGDCLGIGERWNLCNPDNLYDVRLKCKSIERLVLLPALLEYSEESSALADAFLAGFGPVILPFLHTKHSILTWNLELFQRYSAESVGEYRRRFPLTWGDSAMLAWKRLVTRIYVCLPVLASVVNKVVIMVVRFGVRRMGIAANGD